MSVNTPETYSLITGITSKIPELQNPIELVQEISERENEFCKIQDEIKTLYNDCQKENLCPYYKEVAKDMVANITDGRFKDFYKGKPQLLNTFEANPSETAKHVEVAKKELENLPIKTPVNKEDLLKIVAEVNKHKSGIVSGDIVAKCVGSLEKFKSNFENLEVSEDLLKNSKRDPVFEDELKKVISNVKEFQKIIDARRTIISLSARQEKAVDYTEDPIAASSFHTDIISGLLKDVERVKYTELED